MIRTLAPVWAKTTPVLIALTVLPSEFDALVIRMDLGGEPARDNINAVLSARYASPITEYLLSEPAISRFLAGRSAVPLPLILALPNVLRLDPRKGRYCRPGSAAADTLRFHRAS